MIKNYVTNGIFASTLLGIYYLFTFTYFEEIPFPIDMSVLPAVLLAQGILCLLFTIIALLYSLMSVIILPDHFDISYSKLFYARPNWIKSKEIASIINYSIFFCSPPLISFVVYELKYPWTNEIMLFCLVLVPLLFSYYALTPKESIFTEKGKSLRTFRYWKTFFTFFYVSILSLTSLLVFGKYVEFGFGIKSDYQFYVAITIFFLISYFVLIPIRKKDAFQIIARQHSTNENIFSDIRNVPAFYAYAIALFCSLLPPMAAKTSAMSFKILNMGGGVQHAYYFTKKATITVPPDLIGYCNDDNYCITKSLYVILDLGNALYVKGNYFNREGTIVSLPKQHLNFVSLGKAKSED